VRINPFQAGECCARQRKQMMDDRQLDFGHDGKLVLQEQVVIAMNAAADRILDRHDPVGRRTGVGRGEHLLETPARQQLRLGIDAASRGFAECTRFTLICDLHN